MKSQSDSYSQITVLKKLVLLSKKYYFKYLFLCFLALILSLTAIGEAEALRRMVNGATILDVNLIVSGAVLFFVIFIFATLLDWYKAYSTTKLNLNTTYEVQMKVIEKLNRSKLSAFKNYHSGDLISRVHDSVTKAQTGLNIQIMQLIQNAGTVIFLVVYLSILNWQLTLITLFFAGILPFLMNFLSNKIRKSYDQLQKEEADYQSFLQESFQGAEIVKSFSLLNLFTKKLKAIYSRLIKIIKKIAIFEATLNQTGSVIVIGGLLFVLAYGGRLVFLNELDFGALVAFLVSFERIIQPLSALLNSWPRLQGSISAAKRVFDILDLEEEKTLSNGLNLSQEKSACVELRDVFYKYDNSSKITINEVNMKFEAGRKVAIVGPSGGGKSTILELLMQFNQPLQGEILYNKLNISKLSRDEWRNNIAYVSQETILFTDTILNNIKYGWLDATEEEVIEAAKTANIHDDIIKKPDGYHMIVDEGGSNLSGGQRQRIALARALLRNPLIYIFDEPTSSLDGVTEASFQNTLDEIMQDNSCIYITVSHRLHTIKNADYIYVIKDGYVIEEGNHSELSSREELYYEYICVNS